MYSVECQTPFMSFMTISYTSFSRVSSAHLNLSLEKRKGGRKKKEKKERTGKEKRKEKERRRKA